MAFPPRLPPSGVRCPENPESTGASPGASGPPPPGLSPLGAGEDQVPPIPSTLPILPTREVVLFPGAVVPLTIGRASSRKLLEDSLPHSKLIGMFTQRDAQQDAPGIDGLHRVGVAALVLKLVQQPDGSAAIIVRVLERITLGNLVQTQPFLVADVEVLRSIGPRVEDKQWQATVQQLRDTAVELVRTMPDVPEQAANFIMNLDDPGRLADMLASSLDLGPPEKQDLLEELDVARRVRAVLVRLGGQLEIARLQQKIQKDVAAQFTDAQRRAFLREQIRTIQKELGEEGEGAEQQVGELRKQLVEAQPPKEVLDQAERELKRLTRTHPASPEFSMIVGYLETLSELPWAKLTEDNLDLERAQQVLDRDHFDLEKVKRRLIEYLAVRKLNPTGHGPILCFLGPPGVGKTSLGESIADALGRKFVRVSLGGMRDEAEIRGHRRTYVGAMPGRLLQELRRAGTRNPVMMLDEIDKLGADFRGDPASALLEVLDPRQNHAFVDHYLGVSFDLSQVMFITTANMMETVPPPLRDRMEVIHLPGYSDREKQEIAKRYLVPRQLKENGLSEEQCRFEPAALERIAADYTHESGVRELERQIGAVCRSVGAMVARGETKNVTVVPDMLQGILGPPKYVRETKLSTSKPGVVTGLAWTPVGGEILHIEALRYPGKGNILLTGQIGNVMKESAQAALSLVKSRVRELQIEPEAFKDTDIHIHVPAGAVPKDGPSAGGAMFTAIASLFTDRPVRSDVGMTGEISLRGLVLPVGGLKEKSLAAQRAGLTTVIIPKLNEKDLTEIPPEVKEKLTFLSAETVDDVLGAALEPGHGREAAKLGGASRAAQQGESGDLAATPAEKDEQRRRAAKPA
jgi:ATP-dependent Lon protease